MMKPYQDSNPQHQPQQHPTVCGQCGIEEKKLLHNVRLRGNFRRLCTNCVLRLHPQCFCPWCLGVFEKTPPENAVVCFKCYSSSHPNCVISQPMGGSARGPVPCSVCLNPGSLVLNLNVGNNGVGRGIDVNAARLLLAAGKIAAMSMSKAEVAAAMEAERRAKEAAFTKKRAREALDHVVKMMVKEKSSGNVVKKKVVVAVKEKVDGSNEVMEALNAVELKESGRPAGGVGGINNNSNNKNNNNNNNNNNNGVVVMDVDVVNGKVSGVSVVENGSVKMDGLVKVVNEEKVSNGGQEQGLGKVKPMVESNVVSGPKPVS